MSVPVVAQFVLTEGTAGVWHRPLDLLLLTMIRHATQQCCCYACSYDGIDTD